MRWLLGAYRTRGPSTCTCRLSPLTTVSRPSSIAQEHTSASCTACIGRKWAYQKHTCKLVTCYRGTLVLNHVGSRLLGHSRPSFALDQSAQIGEISLKFKQKSKIPKIFRLRRAEKPRSLRSRVRSRTPMCTHMSVSTGGPSPPRAGRRRRGGYTARVQHS